MNIKSIIAPSASGKTTFCKSHSWCRDGDEIRFIAHVYRIMGERFGERWWLGDGASSRLQEKDRWMRGLRAKAASLGAWFATAELELSSSSSIFVIPSAETLVKYSVKRNNPLQPIYTFAQADENRAHYVRVAARFNSIVFPSFDDMDKAMAR